MPTKGKSLQQTNKEKFDALVRQWSADLYRFAFWLCGDKSVAEELVQETYARAWKSIDQLRDDKAAKGWLFTILRRENARRFERKRLTVVDGADPDVTAGHAEYDTSTEAFVLRQALAELPEKYREPLVLQVLGGYSVDEIAEMLDLSSGAVMTRLFRARNKLRDQLEASSS